MVQLSKTSAEKDRNSDIVSQSGAELMGDPDVG